MQNRDVWREAYVSPHDVIAIGIAELVKHNRGNVAHFTVSRLVKYYLRAKYGVEPPRYRSARHFTYVTWILQYLCTRGVLFCRETSRSTVYYVTKISPLWSTDPDKIRQHLPRIIPQPHRDFEPVIL
ncbi:MAG: hypothetical protein ACP5MH_11405 [Thermoproteus sp.]